jgi:hypothetical protein
LNCNRCQKEFEFLNIFSPFGHDNVYKKQEYIEDNGYCDECFEIKHKELDNLVYSNIQEEAS